MVPNERGFSFIMDYSDPLISKKIARDNRFIYSSLIKIYSRPTQFPQTICDSHSHMRKKWHSLGKQSENKRIQAENVGLAVKLLKAKPTKDVAVKELNKFWKAQTDLKKKRRFNREALIKASI